MPSILLESLQVDKMTTNFVRRTTSILVLNPNSSTAMTRGVEDAIRGMDISQVCFHEPILPLQSL